MPRPSASSRSSASSTTARRTTRASVSPTSRLRPERGFARAADRVPHGGQVEGGPEGSVVEIRSDLLHGEATHARATGSPPHGAEETLTVLLERGGVERLAIIPGQTEVHRLEPAARDSEAEALDDERRVLVLGLEPVGLALAEREPAAVLRARERQDEEAQSRRIHDLRAVVIDPALAVHAVVVFASHAAAQCIAATSSAAAREPSEAASPTAPAREPASAARRGRRYRRHTWARPGSPT